MYAIRSYYGPEWHHAVSRRDGMGWIVRVGTRWYASVRSGTAAPRGRARGQAAACLGREKRGGGESGTRTPDPRIMIPLL